MSFYNGNPSGSYATDLVIDINGYFVSGYGSPSTTLAYYPVTPCRIADTRTGYGFSGSFGPPSLSGGATRSFPVLSSSCNIPSVAQAYSLNFAAIPPGALGYLTVWPYGESQPTVSTLNDGTGTVVANAAIIPAGMDSGGSINVFAPEPTDLVIDIDGYYAPPGSGGLALYTVTPCRVLDTRNSSSAFQGELDVNVTASGCIGSSGQQAYVFNASVVPSASLGYLTLWQQGTPQPLAATLNALDGAITSNTAVVPTSNTEVSAFANSSTNLILDLFGYFAPPASSPDWTGGLCQTTRTTARRRANPFLRPGIHLPHRARTTLVSDADPRLRK